MTDLFKYINFGKSIVTDGAMGTMLIKHGLKSGQCPEEMNISSPSTLEKIHAEYFTAGAQILETNTFGANRLALKKYGLEKKIDTIIYNGVKISKGIANNKAFVGLSVGPTGEMMRPFGAHSFEDIYSIYLEQIEIGVEAGVDLVCIETMGDIGELKAAYLAARNFDIPISCSVSFDDGGRTLMGTAPEIFARTLSGWDCDIVGTNCGSPDKLIEVFKKIVSNTKKPCYISPNAGRPIYSEQGTFYPMKPQEFAQYGIKFREIGANILGGCCGTSPEHIEELCKKVSNLKAEITQRDENDWLTSSVNSVLLQEKLHAYTLDIKKYISNDYIDYDKISGFVGELSDNVYDIILLDVTDIENKGLETLVELLQVTTRKPLAFKVNDKEILEKCIKPYKGIAGVICTKIPEKDLENILTIYGGKVIDSFI